LLSKQEGGFGIKDLHWQNRCLLLNFIHKLHQPDSLPWKDWFRNHFAQDFGDALASPYFLDKIVADCLPLYRSITRVALADGSSTAFWKDKWLPGPCLAERFPALFTHCLRPNVSVATTVSEGLHLQPRLTTAASSQLAEVSRLIAGIQLREGHDARFIDSPSSPPFSSRAAYRMLAPVHAADASACTAWGSRLPAKVKIFTYLADIDRLSSRANLFFKNCGAVETGRHIFFDCPAAAAVWARIGTPIPGGAFSI
jgi:hypothetical protein